MLPPLPDITQVNFGNPEATEGFAALIFATYNTGALTAAQTSALRKTAKTWLTETTVALPTYTPGSALTITNCYDLIHRIAYRTPANQAILNRYILRALEASLHKDPSVDLYQLHRTVTDQITNHNPTFLAARPLQWQCQYLDHWHKQFRYGRSLTPLSPYDTIQRVSILLTANLWPYETANEPRFKQKLFDNHRHYINTPSSPSPLSLLSALSQLLTASLTSLPTPTTLTTSPSTTPSSPILTSTLTAAPPSSSPHQPLPQPAPPPNRHSQT